MRLIRPSNKEMAALVTDRRVRSLLTDLNESCVVEEILQAAWLTPAERSYGGDAMRRFYVWRETTPEGQAETDRVSLLIGRKMMPMLRQRAAQWEWRLEVFEEEETEA